MLYGLLEKILWRREHYHGTLETDNREEHVSWLSFLLMVCVLLIFSVRAA